MRFCSFLLLVSLFPTALAAADPMTEAEFAARVTGKTFFFSQSGQPFGAETYGEDRSVTWTYADGSCVEGGWYAEVGAICFAYLQAPDDPLCWHFFDTEGVVSARIVGADPAEDLTVTGELDMLLPCVAPGSGI